MDITNYKSAFSKYQNALNRVTKKEEFEKTSLEFLKEVNKIIKETDKTSDLHTELNIDKALDVKNGMKYCDDRGLGLNTQFGAMLELGRRAVQARNKWHKQVEKVIKGMQKLASLNRRLTKYSSEGNWERVRELLGWILRLHPADIRDCALGENWVAVGRIAGLSAEARTTYREVEYQLFSGVKQNAKGLIAAVNALKINANKMPQNMNFSGGISIETEDLSNIKSLKDLSEFLLKHPMSNIMYRFSPKNLHTAADNNTENLKADVALFIKENPRLGIILEPDKVATVVSQARETLDRNDDVAEKVIAIAKAALDHDDKVFMEKVKNAQKALENKGKSPEIIQKRTKNTMYRLAVKYFRYALHFDSLMKMKREWVGEGNHLDESQFHSAWEDAEKTKENLRQWIEQEKFGTTADQAMKVLPRLAEYMDAWKVTVDFVRSSNEIFKSWVNPAENIKKAAIEYQQLLDSLVLTAKTQGANYFSEDFKKNKIQLKDKSTIGWKEIRVAKQTLSPDKIVSAINKVHSRKDCDVDQNTIKKLCASIESVAKIFK